MPSTQKCVSTYTAASGFFWRRLCVCVCRIALWWLTCETNAPHAFREKLRTKICTVRHWLKLAEITFPALVTGSEQKATSFGLRKSFALASPCMRWKPSQKSFSASLPERRALFQAVYMAAVCGAAGTCVAALPHLPRRPGWGGRAPPRPPGTSAGAHAKHARAGSDGGGAPPSELRGSSRRGVPIWRTAAQEGSAES